MYFKKNVSKNDNFYKGKKISYRDFDIDENFDTICIEYQSNEGDSNESYDYDCGAWATLASHCFSTLSALPKRNFY